MTTLPMGEKDQTYEVSFYDNGKKERRVLGWASSPAGAESLRNSVRIHPSWSDPEVKIREDIKPPVLPAQPVPEKPTSAKRSYE